jgi:hypothetical protein
MLSSCQCSGWPAPASSHEQAWLVLARSVLLQTGLVMECCSCAAMCNTVYGHGHSLITSSSCESLGLRADGAAAVLSLVVYPSSEVVLGTWQLYLPKLFKLCDDQTLCDVERPRLRTQHRVPCNPVKKIS